MEITSFWTQKNWIKLKMAGTPECHGWQDSWPCSLESTHRRQQKHGHGLFTGYITSRSLFFLNLFSCILKKNIFEGINSSIFGKTLIPVTCFAVYFFFNLKNYCFVSKRQKKYLVEVKLLQSHWPWPLGRLLTYKC